MEDVSGGLLMSIVQVASNNGIAGNEIGMVASNNLIVQVMRSRAE